MCVEVEVGLGIAVLLIVINIVLVIVTVSTVLSTKPAVGLIRCSTTTRTTCYAQLSNTSITYHHYHYIPPPTDLSKDDYSIC